MYEGCIARTNGNWRSCLCGCPFFVIIRGTNEKSNYLNSSRHDCICLSCGEPTFNIYLPANNVITVTMTHNDFILGLYESSGKF